ncbi:MAG: ABC transporter substrate-binding protein [Rhodobacteraceae bacterium]|nr:ABC transporter substrate-binding protein [Paracoccaceae bacterium]
MPSNVPRRAVLTLMPGAVALAVWPYGAMAMTVDEARSKIGRVVADINAIINSGKPEAAMLKDFEQILVRYADVNYIAKSALGPAGRSASAAEIAAYTQAFQGYIARKYGRRFREFIGGEIEVVDARPLKSFYEVQTIAKLKGEAPFEVRWHVFEKGGKSQFFNLIIEGVNMLAAERTEVGAMLDQAGRSIPKLTEALKQAG